MHALADLVLTTGFGLTGPAVVLAQHGLAATEQPHRSLATGVQRKGAWHLQWRTRPSGEYSDQKRRSLAPQAASSCGITVCQ